MSTFFILSRGFMAKTKPIPHAGRRWLAAKALTAEERSKALAKFEGAGPFTWKEVDGRDALTKTFEFTDFSQAWSFMSRSALLAEKMEHHPEWCNVYNRVEVTLTTHDCGGLSPKDIEMATLMDEYAHDLIPAHRSP